MSEPAWPSSAAGDRNNQRALEQSARLAKFKSRANEVALRAVIDRPRAEHILLSIRDPHDESVCYELALQPSTSIVHYSVLNRSGTHSRSEEKKRYHPCNFIQTQCIPWRVDDSTCMHATVIKNRQPYGSTTWTLDAPLSVNANPASSPKSPGTPKESSTWDASHVRNGVPASKGNAFMQSAGWTLYFQQNSVDHSLRLLSAELDALISTIDLQVPLSSADDEDMKPKEQEEDDEEAQERDG